MGRGPWDCTMGPTSQDEQQCKGTTGGERDPSVHWGGLVPTTLRGSIGMWEEQQLRSSVRS